MGIRAQGNPIASFADLWSQTGTDASTNPISGAATATGGTKTTPGDGYIYHHFYATVPGAPYTKTPKSSETLVVDGELACDILIVGGGGAGGPSTGAGSHPGSSNVDATSPPVGWGYDGAGGSLDPCNCGSGGGGGGIGGAPYATGGNYFDPGTSGYSTSGEGGIGAKYTIDGATVNIGGGGMGGAYSAAGNQTTPTAHPFGGGIQDSRDWPAPMRIYPAPTVNIMFGGLDGSGGGGAGGSNNVNGPQVISGAPDGPTPANDPWSPLARAGNTASGRGGCGLVQIRYPV